MKRKKASQVPQDIQQLLEQIERWRNSKPKPRAMPQHLWQDAASLVPEYGAYKVSSLLKIDYAKLRRLTKETPPTPSNDVIVHNAVEPTEFVSLPQFLFSAPSSSPTVLELSSSDGRSLVIRTHQPLDLDALIHSF